MPCRAGRRDRPAPAARDGEGRRLRPPLLGSPRPARPRGAGCDAARGRAALSPKPSPDRRPGRDLGFRRLGPAIGGLGGVRGTRLGGRRPHPALCGAGHGGADRRPRSPSADLAGCGPGEWGERDRGGHPGRSCWATERAPSSPAGSTTRSDIATAPPPSSPLPSGRCSASPRLAAALPCYGPRRCPPRC